MPKRVAIFMGTRPEAIKMAPVVRAFADSNALEPIVVSTGQHREMLQQVVDVFEIPVDHDLDVMAPDQTLASLSARLMTKVDDFLDRETPDFALVQGDTTTVLMAALACFYRGIPVGHVEAGLRTGHIRSPFPEEANRKLVTPLASLHFAPTEVSAQNLKDEAVDPETIEVTGNTVIDALNIESRAQNRPEISAEVDRHIAAELGEDWRSKKYVLVTGHRRENFGQGFDEICSALTRLATEFPEVDFVYPVHLNPRVRGPVMEQLGHIENLRLLSPMPYRPFVALMKYAKLVLTDSGGIQEEAPGLGKPVLVMRDTTERPEGVSAGTVRLVGADAENIVRGVSELLTNDIAYRKMAEAHNPYGDGLASERIVEAVAKHLGVAQPARPRLARVG